MKPLPDLATLSDDDLKALIEEYVKEENEVSYRRRIIHGYIDILRTEMLARKKQQYGDSGHAFDDLDIDRLSEILAGKGTPDASDE